MSPGDPHATTAAFRAARDQVTGDAAGTRAGLTSGRPSRTGVAVLALAVAGALALATAGYLSTRYRAPHIGHVALRRVDPASAGALESVFRRAHYHWPPRHRVPRISVANLPPGLDQVGIDQRKALFFRLVLPLVVAENTAIRRQRAFLQGQFHKHHLPPDSPAARAVRRIARRFGIDGDIEAPGVRARLLRRVDVVPPGLVLAQAATESGWGTSRFAVEGNNLFGMWTYQADRGLSPRDPRPGERHYVRTFRSLRASVHRYIMNIDTGDAYAQFRRLRAQLRHRHKPLNPVRLASGLKLYSSRRGSYVQAIRDMIRANGLESLTRMSLRRRS